MLAICTTNLYKFQEILLGNSDKIFIEFTSEQAFDEQVIQSFEQV